MCYSKFTVHSKSLYGVRQVQVPCGHCQQCREIQQSQWTTRLKAEIEEYHVKKNYNVGFITLTYCNRRLPHIPKRFFAAGQYRCIPCFNYHHVKNFFDTIRNYFFRKFHLNDAFRFFLVCEYGEKFHRPHYHAILLFTSQISHQDMYRIVEDAWCGSSHLIPQPRRKVLRRKFMGRIAPFSSFVPRDPAATGAYVAKYVCKDLAFQDSIDGLFDHLSCSQRNDLRHFSSFHKQSRGFGFCLIRDKSDSELLDMYEKGVQFTGYPSFCSLPIYLKDKILFNTRLIYNLRLHKWETRKFYSKFLMENRDRIAVDKFNQARLMFERFKEKYNSLRYDFQYVPIADVAWFYVLYYGVSEHRCHVMDSVGDQIVVRYDPIADCSDRPLVDFHWHRFMTRFVNYIFAFVSHEPLPPRSKEDEIVARTRAFHNQQNEVSNAVS